MGASFGRMSSLSEDPGSEPNEPLLTYEEISKHNTEKDCWIVVNGKAYDVTDFLDDHPGGPAVVLEAAGMDSTTPFLDAHPEDIMKLTLGPAGLDKSFIGMVDMSTMPLHTPRKADAKAKEHASDDVGLDDHNVVPPLEAILNLHDMEAVAQRVMVAKGKKHAWDYYSSGADDELTYNDNVNAFQRIWLKPRILVNVAEVDTSCSILGHKCQLPIYLSAVAMCGMGHEDGEISWVRAAERAGVLFMVPNLSSKSFDDILAARGRGQVVFLQIYVNPDRNVVLEQIRACEKHGVKALCITVDSAVAGKRERDLRNKIALQLGRAKQQDAAAKGTKARKAGSYANRDPALDWSDIAWFRKQTSIPIVIKGVQTADDAVLAAKAGAAGVVLSNHGGRNCDTSRSGIEVLPEVIEALKEEGLRDKLEVWVDGGVRRGTDVLKALCMGADAVGLGKPAVFSMSAYGEDGIVKMLDTLKDELEKCMRLCGTPSLKDLNPRLVDARSVGRHTDVAPIPSSPYAYVPPAKSVRSPAFPTIPQEREKIQAEITKLNEALQKLDRAEGNGGQASVAHNARIFGKLLKVMLFSVLSSVFATSYSGSLHRSALFLVVFLVVHMGGNLTALFGRDMYNSYGHHINSMPFIRIVEVSDYGRPELSQCFSTHPCARSLIELAALTVLLFTLCACATCGHTLRCYVIALAVVPSGWPGRPSLHRRPLHRQQAQGYPQGATHHWPACSHRHHFACVHRVASEGLPILQLDTTLAPPRRIPERTVRSRPLRPHAGAFLAS